MSLPLQILLRDCTVAFQVKEAVRTPLDFPASKLELRSREREQCGFPMAEEKTGGRRPPKDQFEAGQGEMRTAAWPCKTIHCCMTTQREDREESSRDTFAEILSNSTHVIKRLAWHKQWAQSQMLKA